MTRDEVKELYYITHVDNVASILRHGILSHNEVKRRGLQHVSVAMAEIQERRRKQIPGGRLLHDHANLYFNARNPMMFKRTRDAAVGPSHIVVIRVNADVLDLPGVVIADKNASSDYVLFHGARDGLALLDSALVWAEWWTDDDPIEQYRKRAAICAEVLVPDAVHTKLLVGAYVSCPETAAVVGACVGERVKLDISVNPHIFFM
jgi:hypothetical protein